MNASNCNPRIRFFTRIVSSALVAFCAFLRMLPAANPPPVVEVAGQPLAENAKRLLRTLDFLGAPLPPETANAVLESARSRNAEAIQRQLDEYVLFVVSINPESRVKVSRGPARALLQQGGYTPVVIKVVNDSTVTKPLRMVSRQAGTVYAGEAEFSLQRQDQVTLKSDTPEAKVDRFLDVDIVTKPPMTDHLSGLEVEYAVGLIYSSEAGKREATIGFDVGQGSQDIGFRGETPVLFDVRPAVHVRLSIRDFDGKPTAARLVFKDNAGHIFPPRAKRLAPDFFFQEQIYRHDGDTVVLPTGDFDVQFSRGPEYKRLTRRVTVPAESEARLEFQLERWIQPMDYGFYSGDHHIHGAGCAHYQSPTLGVSPNDMFLQVKGEGLNVGCVLTWGPCFEFQRQYFTPMAHTVSEPFTVIKYDLEISGFGSQALGHVCLLNLKDQTYPGSAGSKADGWPTWTTPVLRWAKKQGAVVGYAHSASGLEINPNAASDRLMRALDSNANNSLDVAESGGGLLPEPFEAIDTDRDKHLERAELRASIDRVADRLPNLAVPEMNGVGAQEICVSTAHGVCDFISAMDTARIAEWNCWYHIMNCGFPLKVSGETDFPCMSGTRVGQGRVYVQLGKVAQIDFGQWCRKLGEGRSYISDGYAHALEFRVDGRTPGDGLRLDAPGQVEIRAKVAFAPQTPKTIAQGGITPPAGKRIVGDTVNLHGPRSVGVLEGGERVVEIVANGQPVASRNVRADGTIHDLQFSVAIERSSWIALRQFPQLHTNPVNVLVGDKPIRASRKSGQWCIETIEQLWRARERRIAPHERGDAFRAFRDAVTIYRKRIAEAPEGS